MKKQRVICLNNKAGITLVALVITIIVLLILSGVSISVVFGNNGLLNQTTTAAKETRKESVKEEISLAWARCYNDYFVESSIDITKQKADYFTQENLQKYLAGKGIISDLEYSSNGISVVVYKSETDNFVYTVEIENDIPTIVGEPYKE